MTTSNSEAQKPKNEDAQFNPDAGCQECGDMGAFEFEGIDLCRPCAEKANMWGENGV
jgi:hypothetical protein